MSRIKDRDLPQPVIRIYQNIYIMVDELPPYKTEKEGMATAKELNTLRDTNRYKCVHHNGRWFIYIKKVTASNRCKSVKSA